MVPDLHLIGVDTETQLVRPRLGFQASLGPLTMFPKMPGPYPRNVKTHCAQCQDSGPGWTEGLAGGWIFEPDRDDTSLLYLQSPLPCCVSGSHNPMASTVGDDRKSYPSSVGLLGACWSGGHGGEEGPGRAGYEQFRLFCVWTDSWVIPW